MAENQPKKSRKESVQNRMKKKYPDRNFEDEEELFGQIDDDFAANEEEIGKYRQREESLTNVLSGNPMAAQFVTALAKGESPWAGVIEHIGIDGWTELINDPSKQEELAEANRKYVERVAKEKKLEEEYKANFAESMKMLEQMQQERGLSDENIDAAMDLIMKMVGEAILGKFTPETVDMALKALNHDADAEAARTEGEVAGRNAKIEERVRKPQAGDGLPAMAGSNNGPTRRPEKAQTIFDVARGTT